MIRYSKEEVVEWLTGISDGTLDLVADNTSIARAAIGYLRTAPAPELTPPLLPPGYLSPHFTLAEMTYSVTANTLGIDNTPNDDAEMHELRSLCNLTLEKIRTACGNNPVVISSGYRCRQVNEAVGGADNSAHLYGCAADFTIPAYGSVDAVCETLVPLMKEFGIDQLINETDSEGRRWVHVGRCIPPATEPKCEYFPLDG